MKTIVTVRLNPGGTIRIYEVPEGIQVKAGDIVIVEYKNTFTFCPGEATQDAIEVADDIVAYFTDEPLLNIKAVMTAKPAEPQEGPKNEEN